jgi:hypothetical protein
VVGWQQSSKRISGGGKFFEKATREQAMSDDFHRPTYTTPAREVHGAFNATQVRLYGIPGLPKRHGEEDVLDGFLGNSLVIVPGISRKAPTAEVPNEEEDAVEFQHEGDSNDETKNGFIERLERALMSILSKASSNSSYVFVKSIFNNYMIMLGSIDILQTNDDSPLMSSGIIFGYAYEGHTYDLPKPKIMMIPANPEPIPDDDSGYDLKTGAGYAVWIVDKLDQCVEIEVNQGFVEQIVLEANLPGKRAPTMYAGRMMMGHRSGRLSE